MVETRYGADLCVGDPVKVVRNQIELDVFFQGRRNVAFVRNFSPKTASYNQTICLWPLLPQAGSSAPDSPSLEPGASFVAQIRISWVADDKKPGRVSPAGLLLSWRCLADDPDQAPDALD